LVQNPQIEEARILIKIKAQKSITKSHGI